VGYQVFMDWVEESRDEPATESGQSETAAQVPPAGS